LITYIFEPLKFQFVIYSSKKFQGRIITLMYTLSRHRLRVDVRYCSLKKISSI